MTVYERKRKRVGLTSSEMAKLLEVKSDLYDCWEKGDITMPSLFIDKFNRIINRGKQELKIESINRKEEVEKWWNEIIEDKKIIKELMKKFNITSFDELGRLIGYSNGTTICSYINKNRECGFNIKNKLFSFFEDETNVQIPKKKNLNLYTTRKEKYNNNIESKIKSKLKESETKLNQLEEEIINLQSKKNKYKYEIDLYLELLK